MYLFLATLGLHFSSCGSERGLLSSCSAQTPHCGIPSHCGAQALGTHRLSSCDTWVYLPCGMWLLPRQGREPVSPASAGGFLTTLSPGKSNRSFKTGEVFWPTLANPLGYR